MIVKESSDQEPDDIADKLLAKRRARENIAGLLEKDSRLQIVLYLFAYPKQSLSQLTDNVGKSKSTISRDLSVLLDGGVVREVKNTTNHGNAKSYELTTEFIDENLLNYADPELFATLTNKERKELFRLTMAYSEHTIQLLEKMLLQVSEYLHSFQTRKEGLDISTFDVFQSWMNEFGVTLRMMPMNQELFGEFLQEYQDFIVKFQEEHNFKLENELKEADYLIWSIFLPLKKIIN